MILAIDIGNTNTSFGIFNKQRIERKFDIPTKNLTLKILKKKLSKTGLADSIICSVVPSATKKLSRNIRIITGNAPCIIGKEIKVPVKNLYRKPQQVGCDRLVNAYAGIEFYGAPLIIIDFGTAITFDVISKKGEYLGGMILPGLKLSLEVLAQKTALLPKVELQKPKDFIGRDTKNSMLSGIIYGYAALTDDLTDRIKQEIGKNAVVIGTGGNIKIISGFCGNMDKIDPLLTLKGINMIYHRSVHANKKE